jgi:transposase
VDQGTTVLFGLPGVRVERVEAVGDGTRVVHVATDDPTSAACPSCGVISTSVKEYPTTTPRDLPYGESALVVVWRKVRWRCRESACPWGSFTEQVAEVPAGRRTTGRLRRAIATAIGEAARSVAEVADAHGVSWPTGRATPRGRTDGA